MKNVTVVWFDGLQGVGEGFDQNGEVIFLNALKIVNTNTFKSLNSNEKVLCEISSNGRNKYASHIVKGN